MNKDLAIQGFLKMKFFLIFTEQLHATSYA